VAALFETGAKRFVVIDLAVEDEPRLPTYVAAAVHRLVTGR
jgi:hypothetical protein